MPDIRCIAVVGTGAMGTGIAQIAAQAGLTVWLFDNRAEAAAEARQRLQQTFESLCDKGKLSAADAAAAQNRLRVEEHRNNWATANWWWRPSSSAWRPSRNCCAGWKP